MRSVWRIASIPVINPRMVKKPDLYEISRRCRLRAKLRCRPACGLDRGVTPRYITEESPCNAGVALSKAACQLLCVLSEIEFLDHTGGKMDRRSMIRSTRAMAVAGGCTQAAPSANTQFVFVAGGEDRFRDETMFPRCKLSGKDTNGALCVLGGDHNNLFSAAVPLLFSQEEVLRSQCAARPGNEQEETDEIAGD
jgi:hypothetical protein